MTYRGRATPGSPAVRDLPKLRVTKASVGPMDNNAYLLQCRDTDELVLIDAAAEPDVLLGLLGGQPLARVITTHRHRDHWSGLAQVVAATGAETVAGADDVAGISVTTSRSVRDGETVAVGASNLTVIHLVGHTPRLDRPVVRRPGRDSSSVHRRQPLPRRPRPDHLTEGLPVADGRPGGQGLRSAARRDMVLPRPRRRLHPRRRASSPGRMAVPRLVVTASVAACRSIHSPGVYIVCIVAAHVYLSCAPRAARSASLRTATR